MNHDKDMLFTTARLSQRRLGTAPLGPQLQHNAEQLLRAVAETTPRGLVHAELKPCANKTPPAGPKSGGSVDLDGRVDGSDEGEAGEEADGARDKEEGEGDDEHVPYVEYPRHRARHLQPRRSVVDGVEEQVPAQTKPAAQPAAGY